MSPGVRRCHSLAPIRESLTLARPSSVCPREADGGHCHSHALDRESVSRAQESAAGDNDGRCRSLGPARESVAGNVGGRYRSTAPARESAAGAVPTKKAMVLVAEKLSVVGNGDDVQKRPLPRNSRRFGERAR